MRTLKYSVTAVLLVLGLWVVSSKSAHAVVFDSSTTTTYLSNWNVAELDSSDDQVVVISGMVGGNTAFAVYWDGGTNDTVGAQAIDKFWYDFNCTGGTCYNWVTNPPNETGPKATRTYFADGVSAVEQVWLYDVSTDSLIGNAITDEWDLNGNVIHADGFDMLYGSGDSQTSGNSGHPGGESMNNALLFVLAGVVDPTSMFAAHVRYDNDCSGFASNAVLKDGKEAESQPNCVAAPEPSSVALLGIALFALAAMGAWRRRTGVRG